MIYLKFRNIGRSISTKIAVVFALLLMLGISSFAQKYKGAPVKKDRLIKALESRQLQTRDIVTIIKRNGVNFALTSATRKRLIAAGARNEVIDAVDSNLRLPSKDDQFNSKSKNSSADYADLLDQAIYIFKQKNNPEIAVRFLKLAAEIQPENPSAYQMLGFINLYGLKKIPQAQEYMKQAITKGGSGVFRVYHDDNGKFTKRCIGSLYISPDSIRFESDDNIHTFETSTRNVQKVKLDRESNSVWKKRTIFKVFLNLGGGKTKFRFAPISGRKIETRMAAQLFIEAKININYKKKNQNLTLK